MAGLMKKIPFLHCSLVLMATLLAGGIASAADPMAKRVEGHWGVDKAFLMDKMKEQSGGELPPEVLPMIETMASKFVITLKDGKAEMLAEEGEGTYTISDADDAAGTCTMELTEPEGKDAKKIKVEIKGDAMTLTPEDTPGDQMRLLRLSKEEFEKLKAAAEAEPEGAEPEGEEPAEAAPAAE